MLTDLLVVTMSLSWLVTTVVVSDLRDTRHDLATERGERQRLQVEKADWLRATRLGRADKHAERLLEAQRRPAATTQKALPAGPQKPKPPQRELEPGAFSDIAVIDLPPGAAHTEERPLPTLPTPPRGQRFPKPNPRKNLIDPMRPDHEPYRRKWWPGQTKENARAR